MPLQERPRFYVPLYLIPTAMSFLTGNQLMDLFHLLKENFKNLLFGSLILGASRIFLIYQIVRCQKGDSEEHGRTYFLYYLFILFFLR